MPDSHCHLTRALPAKDSGVLSMILSPLPAILLLLSLSGQVFAKDYMIEIIVLENRGSATSSAQSLYLPRVRDAFGLTGEKALEAGFELVETDLALVEVAESIEQSPRHRMLRHFAWRQPGLDDDSARSIRINVGSAFKVHIPQEYTQYDYFIPATATPALNGSSRELTSTTVSGTLTVRLGRFLHLDAVLAFTDTDKGVTYRLNQSRKMRSRELHYIDNPRFGLLARIRPIEEE
ncbi:MAG: peptidoglycan binding protein CsiV [Gammaproteobacteria bacterium]|nr:peptidoglycan binding protein CsiV [Gammaproteobacteria bacterium]